MNGEVVVYSVVTGLVVNAVWYIKSHTKQHFNTGNGFTIPNTFIIVLSGLYVLTRVIVWSIDNWNN
jgi:hypothetical protein